MPITRAQLVQAFVDSGASRSNGIVSLPEDQCIPLAFRIRAMGTDVPPTVPDADVDEYLEEVGKLTELRNNSPHPIVRALCRRLITLLGG